MRASATAARPLLRSPRPCFCNKQPRRRQSSFPLPPSFFPSSAPRVAHFGGGGLATDSARSRRRRTDARTPPRSSPLESASSERHRHQQPACCAADRQRRRDGRGREGRTEGERSRQPPMPRQERARRARPRPPDFALSPAATAPTERGLCIPVSLSPSLSVLHYTCCLGLGAVPYSSMEEGRRAGPLSAVSELIRQAV